MESCIKMVNRSATSAFAPEGLYMATGTTAGAVDMQFSSSANLDIFELDFGSDDRELILVGTTPTSERFNRLSWGRGPANSEEFSLGIIAGGLIDGNIKLWNPKTLIRSHPNKMDIETSESGFLGQLSRDKGPVRGLEFNSLSPELLASGADEGEICIWDVAKPSEPSHFPPLKGSGSAAQGEISFLSWNSKVQHILASTSFNGTTAIWDLRKQKPVISFKDPIRRRCSVLQWNPDVAPQLVVASDEDSSPSLRLWDMRNIMSPVKEFTGHTRGVISMSWCPIDSSYLLTCAKDNRTICWDTNSGEIVAELPAGTYWNFDVHWYTKIPGVISASSFDGKIGIYNIKGCGEYGIGKSDINAAPLRAPMWYKRKGGVSFGFGGKLVSFHSAESEAVTSEVYVHNLVKEQCFPSRSSEFEALVQSRDRSALRLLCEKKSHESESEQERETWGFIKVMFNEDGTARSDLLSHIGFSLPAERKSTRQNGISEPKEIFCGNKDTTLVTMDSGEDFFNNLPSPMADTPLSTSFNEFVTGDSIKDPQPEMDEPELSSDESGPSFNDSVQRALVVGDYKGAVAKCISANRWADALVIAHVGGSSLWELTRDQYLRTRHSSYLKVVSAMVNNDLMSLAKSRPLKSWKETLALFCTFAQKDEWTQLCDTLAARLFSAGNVAAATLCYICAGNIDKTVEIWSKNLRNKHGEKSYMDNLQDLMEKIMVFALATEHKKFSASLCKLVEKYAEILASQGLLTPAMEYLNILGTEELSLELTILRDRIALSTEPDKEIKKSATYENYQLQTGPSFSADQSSYGVTDTCQHYYHEITPSQMQASIPKSPYGDGYQQPLNTPSTKGYNAPSIYQHALQPNMQQPTIFFPSQASQAQAPVENFHPPPLHNQPTITSFVPADGPVLRNVEQYQQPSLGSQLYPATNTSYQAAPHVVAAYSPNTSNVGQTPGQTMSQGLATAPVSRGFMPINSSGVQRPGMDIVQIPSPTQQAPIQPPAPVPPTVQTVDTSNVPAQQKPVISTLTRLFNETSAALGGPQANPAKKREIEDNSKKLGALFAKLSRGDVSKNAAEKLIQLCQALDKGDFSTALQIQVLLTTTDWDECNFWLSALKRMIKTRQNSR